MLAVRARLALDSIAVIELAANQGLKIGVLLLDVILAPLSSSFAWKQMASQITYKDKEVWTNNMQFSSLIEFAIQVGRRTARTGSEERCVDRMHELNETEFWPGRGIQIEDDFPDVEEQKFWARVFLDTAREIFERRVGVHEHSFWQAQRIWQAYGVGKLFIAAVRDSEKGWLPDSRDYREFDAVVNQREP